MPEDEEMANTQGVLGDGILQDGRDHGAAWRAALRETNARRQQAEADREAQKGQARAESPHRHAGPRKPAAPLRGRRAPTLARVLPDGLARLPRGSELERFGKGLAPPPFSPRSRLAPLPRGVYAATRGVAHVWGTHYTKLADARLVAFSTPGQRPPGKEVGEGVLRVRGHAHGKAQ